MDDKDRTRGEGQAWQAVRLPGDPRPRTGGEAGARLDQALESLRSTRADAGGEDFGALLDAQFDKGFVRLEAGEKVTARVVGVGAKTLLVDVGQRSEGWVARDEFTAEELAKMQPGDPIELRVVRVTGASVRLSRGMSARSMDMESLMEAARTGVPVEGKIAAENKGGFSVDLQGKAQGFVPFSQIEYGTKKAGPEYVGQVFRFRILEVRGRDVILSRAALQREEVEAQRVKVLAELKEGQILQAPVVKVESFGVFVDVGGGLHALVPRSELSWTRQDETRDGLAVGNVLNVQILKVERGGDRPRISASLRALEDDPWTAPPGTLAIGATVRGKVTRLMPFGAFVEVAPGIEGLLHISEMSARERVRTPGQLVKPGDLVDVAITNIDAVQKRVSLSMKVLQVAADEPDPEVKARFTAPAAGRPAPDVPGETAMARAMRLAREKAAKR
jgi:small subunit ribosomal protein S1